MQVCLLLQLRLPGTYACVCLDACVSFSVCYATLQRLDWPLHKTECEGVSGLSRTRAAPFVRLVLRALTRDTQHLCSRKQQLALLMKAPVGTDALVDVSKFITSGPVIIIARCQWCFLIKMLLETAEIIHDSLLHWPPLKRRPATDCLRMRYWIFSPVKLPIILRKRSWQKNVKQTQSYNYS